MSITFSENFFIFATTYIYIRKLSVIREMYASDISTSHTIISPLSVVYLMARGGEGGRGDKKRKIDTPRESTPPRHKYCRATRLTRLCGYSRGQMPQRYSRCNNGNSRHGHPTQRTHAPFAPTRHHTRFSLAK